MKSKYAELFTAKLNDMDLVLFEKHKDWASWTVAKQSNKCFMVSDNFEYFLCLPQHKEACLYWLNGGGVAVKDYPDDKIERVLLASGHSNWHEASVFMCKRTGIRIKPKKEKRWIGVNVTTGKTTSACTHDDEGNYAEDEVRLTNGNLSDWQFIEIEVEV